MYLAVNKINQRRPAHKASQDTDSCLVEDITSISKRVFRAGRTHNGKGGN